MMNNIRDLQTYIKHQYGNSYSINDRNAYTYFEMGSEDEITLQRNISSWKRYQLISNVLCDVSHINLETTVLDTTISMPIMAAPTSLQTWAHPDGELATSKACFDNNTIMGLSSSSTCTLEDVAATNNGVRWFQLYVYRDRSVTMDLIRRAEKHGYKALIITVDHPVLGNRERCKHSDFRLPPRLKLANLIKYHHESVSQTFDEYVRDLYDQSLSWDDIHEIKRKTSLPIIIKGIMNVSDAQKAASYGYHIIVSNHGGRQLDDTQGTCDVLHDICKCVNNRVDVYVDGGIRRGVDIIKALALGAKAVFIGRPIIYGLMYNGYDGVKQVFEILRNELHTLLALIGCTNISELNNNGQKYVKLTNKL